jgi:hypothetical protein
MLPGCGGPLQVPWGAIVSPTRHSGIPLTNTVAAPLFVTVGGPQGWPAVASPNLVAGMPLMNTLPLPAAIVSPHDVGSPILIAAGITFLYLYLHFEPKYDGP